MKNYVKNMIIKKIEENEREQKEELDGKKQQLELKSP